MMVDENDSYSLSPEKALIFQHRISNYLRSFRTKNNIPHEKMATKFGCTTRVYYRMESDRTPYNPFINSLESLMTFAKIHDLSLSEFASYMDGTQEREQQKILKWKLELIDLFENIRSKTLRNFLAAANTDSKEEKEILESILNLYVNIKNKKITHETADHLIKLANSLAK